MGLSAAFTFAITIASSQSQSQPRDRNNRAASQGGGANADDDDDNDSDDDDQSTTVFQTSTINTDSTPDHSVRGGLSLGGEPGVENGNVRYARLKDGESVTMLVDRSFHVVIGFCQPMYWKGDLVTAHSQLVNNCRLRLEDVLFGGSVTCTGQGSDRVYEAKLNSSTVNETHWENRSLSDIAEGESEADYFQKVVQRIMEKVERGEMYWCRDYVSAV